MTIDFSCDACNIQKTVAYSLLAGPPTYIICDGCGTQMQRVWTCTTQIPDWFGDDIIDTIKHRMEHSRPTGRQKIFY